MTQQKSVPLTPTLFEDHFYFHFSAWYTSVPKTAISSTNCNFNVNRISHFLPRTSNLQKHSLSWQFVMCNLSKQKVFILRQKDNLRSLQPFPKQYRSLESSTVLSWKWEMGCMCLFYMLKLPSSCIRNTSTRSLLKYFNNYFWPPPLRIYTI